jgi:hypothetical protein
MVRRAHHFALAAALLFASLPVFAQVQWQPAASPVVTAENTSWFQAGEAIDWNGDTYYPAGAAQGFNAYQMVRSGAYRGIPLYIDATLEPYSIVFVPLVGGRMQPYERRRTGPLAGTAGSRAPSLPIGVTSEAIAAASMNSNAEAQGVVAQAPGPPMLGPSYESLAPVPTDSPGGVTPSAATAATAPQPLAAVGTSGRIPATAAGRPAPVTSVLPPTGVNAIWIKFDGRRWYAAGTAIDYDASALEEIGTYQGWTVYRRKGDASVIYVPSVPGRLAPYARR